MGVRVQHPQELIDRATYGELAGHPDLPPAYYKLATKVSDGRGVYSFCMCPGGEIVNAASQKGGIVTNGMSNHDRDSGYANSGILVDVRPEDYIPEMTMNLVDAPPLNECANPTCSIPHHDRGIPAELAGMAYQEYYEHLAFVNGGSNYSLPTTTWGKYREAMEAGSNNLPGISDNTEACGKAGFETDVNAEAVINSLPDFVARDIAEAMPVFGRRIKGFDGEDTIIKAIESRSSSPVRILRDRETLEACYTSSCDDPNKGSQGCDPKSEPDGPCSNQSHATIRGLYPGGEGAGYAGGITSAAVDGIKIAEHIIDKYCK